MQSKTTTNSDYSPINYSSLKKTFFDSMTKKEHYMLHKDGIVFYFTSVPFNLF